MSAVYFIRLDLIDEDGNVLDENLYWRYSQHQNYSWLVNQPKVDLNPQMTVKEAGKEYDITVTLTNDSQNVNEDKPAGIARDTRFGEKDEEETEGA